MGYWLSIGTSESQDPGGNSSTVSATLYLNNDQWSSYSNYPGMQGYITIGDQSSWYNCPSAYNISPNQRYNSVQLHSWSRTYPHNPDGTRGSVGTYGRFIGQGGYSPGDIGVGGTTFPAIDYVRIPGAPSSVTAVAVGSVITVTSGEASTPGPAIDAYKVSYASSTNGGATWSSWSSETNMSSRVYAYTSLTPGLTYKFRVRAHNVDGDGPFTESNTLFLTAGGKRYTGANWALTAAAAKRFNGSTWESFGTAKRYTDAGTWVSLS